MNTNMGNVQLQTPPATPSQPEKKRVSWQATASKRYYDVDDCPCNSQNWLKRRVRVHDGHSPVDNVVSQETEGRKKTILLPPPLESQDLNENINGPEAKHSLSSLASCEIVGGSSESYTVCDSDSDSDSDTNSDDEQADSVDFSCRTYRYYLGNNVSRTDILPICKQDFIASLSPDPSVAIDTKPEHKPLAEYIGNAKQEIDAAIEEYKLDIGYPLVRNKTRTWVHRLEEVARQAKRMIDGYTEVRSVRKRLGGCAQERDWKFLITKIREVTDSVGLRAAQEEMTTLAADGTRLEVVIEEDEEENEDRGEEVEKSLG